MSTPLSSKLAVKARWLTTACAALLLAAPGSPARAQSIAIEQTTPPAPSILERPARLVVSEIRLDDALVRLSEASGTVVAFSPSLIKGTARLVSCDCAELSVSQALDRLLVGTRVEYTIVSDQVVLTPLRAEKVGRSDVVLASAGASIFGFSWIRDLLDREREPRKGAVGTITGRVTDAATGQGLSGVSIVVEGAKLGVVSDASGRFRLTNVPAGRQRITAISLGYSRLTQEVEVQDGGSTSVDFALHSEAIALDRLIVTGTMGETRVREVPTPITVIDSRQIEKMQVQRVDQLFRGQVPGVVSWNLGPHGDGWTTTSVRGTSSLMGASGIKTYIDGVEIADSDYINSIDPNIIERIELVRGPQASTLYGSDAAGGVLQIFTKKGVPGLTRAQVTVMASAGMIESEYVGSPALTQEHTATVNGGGEDFSYSFGATYLKKGEYLAGDYLDNRGLFAGARLTQGGLTVSLSARYYNNFYGSPNSPNLAKYDPIFNLPNDQTNDQRQNTVGLTLDYQARHNWKHSVTAGIDKGDFDFYLNKPTLFSPGDTLLHVTQMQTARRSVRYNTSLDFNLGERATAFLVGGVDHYTYWTGSARTFGTPRNNGNLTLDDFSSMTRDKWNNTGLFAQTTLGLTESFFFTAGVRAEYNANFGEDYGAAIAPRVGVAYSRPVAGMDVKLRSSWGEAIRPPDPNHRLEIITATYRYLSNPEIGPERQRGWDTGVELYFGGRGSLGITYYDQIAIDLIDPVNLGMDELGRAIYQNQNVGEIANRGWELEGKLNAHPIRLSATYSLTNSTVRTLSPSYTGGLGVGNRMLGVPKHTAGLSVGYDFLKGSAVLDVTHISNWIQTGYLNLYEALFINGDYDPTDNYWKKYNPVTRMSLRVEQALTSKLNAFLRVDNLTDKQHGEYADQYVAAGRTTVLGIRATL